jgi:hypothetical protein
MVARRVQSFAARHRVGSILTTVAVLCGVLVAVTQTGLVGAQSGLAAADTGDFAITVSPSTQTVKPGGTAVFLVEISAVGGFASPVTLTADGLPAGITGSFAPKTVTGSGSSFLTISATLQASLGSVPISVTGTSGTLVHSSDAVASVDFALVPKCFVSVKGTIRESGTGGAAIADATVVVGGLTGRTDASGNYQIDQVPLGTNNAPLNTTLQVSKDTPALNHIGEYWPGSATGLIVCGRTTTIDASLVKVVPAKVKGSVVEGRVVAPDYTTVLPVTPAKPIVGSTVTLPSIASATTDATGNYVFRDNTAKDGLHLGVANATPTQTFTATGPAGAAFRHGYWPNPVAVGSLTPAADVTAPTVGLVPQCTAALSGQIRDGEKSIALAGATVRVQPADSRVADSVSVTTDADGNYSLPELLFGFNNQPNHWNVTVSKAGFATSAVVESTQVSCGGAAVVDQALAPGSGTYGSVSGKVLDSQTKAPLVGVSVSFARCSVVVTGDCQPTKTAPDGTYLLTRIPLASESATIAGTVTAASSADYYAATAPVTVASGAPATAPDLLPLLRRYASIKGTVTDQATGLPVAGAVVKPPSGATCSNPCVTGADGTYLLTKVPLGNLNADANTSVTVTPSTDFWPKTVGTVVKADVVSTLDIPVVKKCPGATILGTVVNAQTQAPISGASVAVTGLTTPALTDDSGAFRLDGIPVGTDNAPKAVSVTASAVNFFSQTIVQTISCGSIVTLNFGARPSISAVTPSSGPIAGGTLVTVTGANLSGATSVSFGGVPGTGLDVASPTSLSVTTPPHAAGSVDVVVTTPNGASETNAATFSYEGPPTPAPTVSGLAPSSGPIAGGTSVTISGSDFIGATSVTFGGVAATGLDVESASSLSVVSPAHAAGAVDVVVTTPGGSSATSAGATFTYVEAPLAAPTVAGVSPSGGPVAGGTSVTITGTNLTGATAVSFGGTAATEVVAVDAAHVTATSPAHAAGAVDVVVTTPAGSSATSAGDTFTYVEAPPAAPTVTGVSPSGGPVAGGTSVTITGTNLTGATAVSFGGLPAAVFSVLSATSVTATSPAHAAGPVDVVVTTPAGSSATSASATFTYADAPPSTCTQVSSVRSVTGSVSIAGEGHLQVDLTIVRLPFGLASFSYGTVEYHGSSPRLDIVAPVLTSTSVARPLSTGCGVRLGVVAYDLTRLPIRKGGLNVTYDATADTAPAQVSVSFLGSNFSGSVASGTLTVR